MGGKGGGTATPINGVAEGNVLVEVSGTKVGERVAVGADMNCLAAMKIPPARHIPIARMMPETRTHSHFDRYRVFFSGGCVAAGIKSGDEWGGGGIMIAAERA